MIQNIFDLSLQSTQIQMLKKNKSINLSVATVIPKSPSIEIVNEGNIFEPRKDPKLQQVEQYVQYYSNKMQSLSDRRKKYQETMDYYQIFKQNSHLNRYNTVIPIEKTQPINQTYFNGNIVQLGDFHFLIAQAPIDLEQFYDVLYNFSAQIIIQLTKYLEFQQPKADRYIPLAFDEDETFKNECIEAQYASQALRRYKEHSTDNVVFISQNQIDKERQNSPETFWWYKNPIIIDKYSLQVHTTGVKKIDDQFFIYDISLEKGPYSENQIPLSDDEEIKKMNFIYYGKWNDHDVISSEKIFKLCQFTYELLQQRKNNAQQNDKAEYETDDGKYKKVVIHCSAGIGRSAVFAVCLYIFQSFKHNDIQDGQKSWQRLKVSVYDAVERLRVCRNPQCVNTSAQFAFLFEFCDYCQRYFDKSKNASDNQVEYNK